MKQKRIIIKILIAVMMLPLMWYWAFKRQDDLCEKYTPVEKNVQVIGIVKKIIISHGFFFEMFDNKPYWEKEYYIDTNGHKYGLNLKVDDSIYKKADSDTLYIIRGDKTFIYTYRP